MMPSVNGLFMKYALRVGGLLFVWVFLAAGCAEDTTTTTEEALSAAGQAVPLVDTTLSAVPHDVAQGREANGLLSSRSGS